MHSVCIRSTVFNVDHPRRGTFRVHISDVTVYRWKIVDDCNVKSIVRYHQPRSTTAHRHRTASNRAPVFKNNIQVNSSQVYCFNSSIIIIIIIIIFNPW